MLPCSWGGAAWPPVAMADDDDDKSGSDDGGDDSSGGNSGSGGDDSGDDNSGSGGGDEDSGDDDGGSGSDDSGHDDDGGGDESSGDDSDSRDDDRRRRSGRDEAQRGRGRGQQRETLFEWWDRVVTGNAPTTSTSTAAGSGGRETVAEEILVVGIGAADLQQALGQGFTLLERRQLGTLGLEVTRLGLPPGLSPESAASRFQTTAPSATVDVNHAYELQADPCVGDYCWGPQLIGWRAGAGQCGGGLRVGMIDTVIDTAQPALRNSRIRRRSFVGASAASPHGTAIASLLVGGSSGRLAGLLPEAELVAADVFGRDGRGRPRTGALEIATALDWLAGEQVGVVNISIAGPPNQILALAVSRTLDRGIPIVAAAGNHGPDAAPAYPAAYPGVLAATAVDRNGAAYERANRGDYIAFAAPGVDLWTVSGDGVVRSSGTSYAAAFLTGVVAQSLPSDGATTAQLAAALSRRAQDLGAPGKDPVFGWGLVRAAERCG